MTISGKVWKPDHIKSFASSRIALISSKDAFAVLHYLRDNFIKISVVTHTYQNYMLV